MNLYDAVVPDKGESFETFLKYENVKIVRIVSSEEVDDKVYTQEESEWVVIVEGSATIVLDKKEMKLSKGESIFIPAQAPHRVTKTDRGTIWLAVHIL